MPDLGEARWWRWRRRPSPAVERPEEPQPKATPLTLMELVRRYRAQFSQEAREAPTVDELQARAEAAQEHMHQAATERIARAIARNGCWFPGDPDV